MTDTTQPKKPRGFAAMTPERRAEISRMGGAAVPAERRNFSQNLDQAREAGRRGGQKSKRKPAPKP